MKLEVTDIINPTYKNRSSALFGGESSGILNWNDLRYPEIYKKREHLRATFWSKSEIDFDSIAHIPSRREQLGATFQTKSNASVGLDTHITIEMALQYKEVLLSSVRAIELAQAIADVSSDASVTSVLATMIDQLNEHILALQEVTGVSGWERVEIEPPHTFGGLINLMRQLVSEYKLVDLPSAEDELAKMNELIELDRSLHADFILTIYDLTIKEHNLERDGQLDVWLEGAIDVAGELKKGSTVVEFDDFDDL